MTALGEPPERHGEGATEKIPAGAINLALQRAKELRRAFRVDADEVRIERRGRAIVLEPIPESWEWLDAVAVDVDEDFVSAVREQPGATERPALAKVFR